MLNEKERNTMLENEEAFEEAFERVEEEQHEMDDYMEEQGIYIRQ